MTIDRHTYKCPDCGWTWTSNVEEWELARCLVCDMDGAFYEDGYQFYEVSK